VFKEHTPGWWLTGRAGGIQDFNHFRLVNVGDPIGPLDAVNLRSVKDLIGEAVGEEHFTRFVYEQEFPQTVWNIYHGLNSRIVSVQVVDHFDDTVVPGINFPSVGHVQLTFHEPTSGTAIIRR